MKRSFAVACVLALTLALGLSTSAGAGIGAETSAKSAKKGKSCKGKKPKAGKSATAQAKKKTCKAKGKGKSKGDAALGDGAYGDAGASVQLNVSSGGTSVVLEYTPPGGCATISYASEPVALTKNGGTWTAKETRAFSIAGIPATAKWDLTVKEPGLTYALDFTIESEEDVIAACKWEGHPKGSLAKIG